MEAERDRVNKIVENLNELKKCNLLLRNVNKKYLKTTVHSAVNCLSFKIMP